MRGRARISHTASKIPVGERHYQLVSGAFLSDLEQSCDYQSIWKFIWDMYEVYTCSPWIEGANWRYWCTWLGGSKR